MAVDPTKSKTTQIKPAENIVVESGASGIYFSATAPVDNLNKSVPQIRVGTASGELACSSANSQLALPQIPL